MFELVAVVIGFAFIIGIGMASMIFAMGFMLSMLSLLIGSLAKIHDKFNRKRE